MKKFLLFAAALLLSVTTMHAQQVEVRRLVACPGTTMGPDGSLVSYNFVRQGNTCDEGKNWQSVYVVVDTRFGVEWHTAPNSISITAGIIEPDTQDAADTMKSCLTLGPNGTFVDEWLLTKSDSCESRSGYVGRHHRYVNDRVCLVGTYNCVLVSLLKPAAQERVKKVWERVRSQQQAGVPR